MTVGEKIRLSRQALGLSQRQLCGDRLTRNMLSQIENGSARPSMDSLAYFAARLGKPISYFLDEDAVASSNQPCMEAARAAYATERHADALSALEAYCSPDPVFDGERGLLDGLCRLSLAKKALEENRIPYAQRLLEEMAASPYFTAPLQREKQLLLGVLPPADDRELLLRAENALAAGIPHRALEYLTAAENHEAPYWNLLSGKAHFAQNAYAQAICCYEKAEPAYPREAAAALEICHRELGDFENAYRYACKLREL